MHTLTPFCGVAFTMALVSTTAQALSAAEQVCQDGYKNTLQKVDVDIREAKVRVDYREHYCRKDGKVNELRIGGTAEFPIENIPFKFSGDNLSKRQKLTEFCKFMSSDTTVDQASFSLKIEPVDEAQKNLNECVRIARSGIAIRHEYSPPGLVTVYGEFKDRRGTTLELQTVGVDSPSVKCSSTQVSNSGQKSPVDGKVLATFKKDFSILCERNPTDQAGKKVYARANIQLGTNHGPYSILMAEDELLGFALGSQQKQNFDKLMSERDRLATDVDGLKGALEGLKVEAFTVYMGQHDINPRFGPRIACRSKPTEWAEKTCGPARRMLGFKRTNQHSGNNCGYNYYTFACIAK